MMQQSRAEVKAKQILPKALLIEDLDRLLSIITRYAQGVKHLKHERDRLEGVVQVKLALLVRKEELGDTV